MRYKQEKPLKSAAFPCTPAGGRTLDTLIKSQVLYQLSYGSIVLWVQNYNLFPYLVHFSETFFITQHNILLFITLQTTLKASIIKTSLEKSTAFFKKDYFCRSIPLSK